VRAVGKETNEKIVTTQLRIPEGLYKKVKHVAVDIDASANKTILIFLEEALEARHVQIRNP
jgi:hypothetical protein